MTEDLLSAIRIDLQSHINNRVILREMDNRETTGTVTAVTQAFVEMHDEDDNRIVRLRLDQIRSVDEPPLETSKPQKDQEE